MPTPVFTTADWFEDYTTQIAIAVAGKSHETSVIVRDSDAHFRGTHAEADAQRDMLRGRIKALTILSGSYRSLKSLIVVFKEFAGKNAQDFDYFHIQQSGDPRFLAVALRIPTVVTLHEPVPRAGETRKDSGLRGLSNSPVERLYRRFADAIVVHTQTGYTSLSDRERRKATVIPKGIEMMSLPQKPIDSKTIRFFGRAAKYKGIDTLVAAMSEVWKAEPRARLQILASPGDPECLVDLPDSRMSATWNGFSNSELERALAGARTVCLPYTNVSGTAVGVQAFASGRPVVASNLEGLRELVTAKELLFELGCHDDLARAVVLALRQNYAVRPIDPDRTMSAIADVHIALYASIARAGSSASSPPRARE